MNRRALSSQAIRLLRFGALVVGVCCPLLTVHAQETGDADADDRETIDEIVVTVDRVGKRVDIDALRLQEARLKVIRDFEFEQYKQEEEFWRLRLRSITIGKSSRITWGYDAQSEAARFRYTQAEYLPIDRVRPAAFVSIRF